MNEFEQFSLLFSQSEKKLQQLKNHAFDTLNVKSSDIAYILLLKNNPNGLAANELSKYSGYDKALISRITNELLEKNYICRNPNDAHKQRGYRLMLTDKGLEFSKDVDQIMKQLQTSFEKNIAKDDLKLFYQTIQIIAKNLQELQLEEMKEG